MAAIRPRGSWLDRHTPPHQKTTTKAASERIKARNLPAALAQFNSFSGLVRAVVHENFSTP
jgi:hypothetical protein